MPHYWKDLHGYVYGCIAITKLANVDDMAIIMSPDADPGMNLSTMAELTNQNPREVMTRLSQRVTRHTSPTKSLTS